MSHLFLKTEYNSEGSYGSTEKHKLYAHHNNTCDVVSIYDEDGKCIISFDDTQVNSILDAINRLCSALENDKLVDGVENISIKEWQSFRGEKI